MTERIDCMNRILISIFLVLWMTGIAVAADHNAPAQRIVSLAPNVTEILFALGLGDRIVGVTTFCDYPEAAKTKPKIGGMSNPSLEAVLLLKPDLVVMTTDGNPKEIEERLRSLNISTLVFTARRLRDLSQGIRELGGVLGAAEKADILARDIEAALTSHQESGASRKKKNAELRTLNSELHKTKVLFIVWPEPLIVAGPGTAMDDAMTLLGRKNIASGAVTEYPKFSLEEVIRQAPDVICIGTGSGMDMRAVSHGMLQRLRNVPAVNNGKVCYLGDNLFRLGPRVVAGIRELAECLR